MGYWAAFEEKEFETLANASLVSGAQGGGTMPVVFGPGQALEARLGFDFSLYLDPTSTTYLLLFGRVPIPGNYQPPTVAHVPPSATGSNVFLQYKRPMYFGPKHRQKTWKGQAFLRFTVLSTRVRNGAKAKDRAQFTALETLENQLAAPDQVRYACPSVWTSPDLYQHFHTGQLLASSSMVRPSALRPKKKPHDYWKFLPSNPGQGRPNPDGPLTPAQTGLDFFHELPTAESRSPSDMLDHLNTALREAHESMGDGESQMRIHETMNRASTGQFLEEKRDASWLTTMAETSTRPQRLPDSEERALIGEAVEVAARAKELGLTWLTVL